MNTPPILPSAFGPSYGSHEITGPRPYRPSTSRNAWMITFADLIALMLTFFVLLFSMSQLQQNKWQSLVESLASNLSATIQTEADKLAADYQVAVPVTLPAADLNFIEPILREHFAAEPLLAGGSIARVDDGLSVSFPGTHLFVGGSSELTERGAKVAFALGSVLRNLDNAIDVNSYIGTEETISAADWETALARSVAVVRILAQSGFNGPVVARGQGNAADFDGRNIRADGLTLLIREDYRK